MPVVVHFFDPRRGEESPGVGPFEFVQMTYDELRDDHDNRIAFCCDEEWRHDGKWWSDFTVNAV